MGQAKLKRMAAELATQHGGDVSAVENVLTQMTQPEGHISFKLAFAVQGAFWVCRVEPKLTRDNEVARIGLAIIEGSQERTKTFHTACTAIFDSFVKESFGGLGTWHRGQ